MDNRKWMVEFDFGETRRGTEPFAMMMGFETEAEAQSWADDHTTDGIVSWYRYREA